MAKNAVVNSLYFLLYEVIQKNLKWIQKLKCFFIQTILETWYGILKLPIFYTVLLMLVTVDDIDFGDRFDRFCYQHSESFVSHQNLKNVTNITMQ